MDVFEAIRGRRSVRAFKSERVSEEELVKILEAGRLAPSAGNVQPGEFIIIREAETKRNLAWAALGQDFIAEAPVVIIVCANLQKAASTYGKRGETLYCLQDTAAATQNMLLAAYSLGLGACWIGAFNEEAVSQTINIPKRFRPVALILIGHSAEKPLSRSKRSLKEMVHYEKF